MVLSGRRIGINTDAHWNQHSCNSRDTLNVATSLWLHFSFKFAAGRFHSQLIHFSGSDVAFLLVDSRATLIVQHCCLGWWCHMSGYNGSRHYAVGQTLTDMEAQFSIIGLVK